MRLMPSGAQPLRTIVAVSAFLFASLAQAAELDLPADWTAPTEPFEIFDDVYWVGTEGLGAYLFTSPAGHILLDVGMPQSAGDVAASIEQLGFALEDVRYLLNTQAHFDHSGGLAALKKMSGAAMVASEGDRYSLEEGVYEGWESRTEFNFPPVAVDRVIGDGETVRVGEVVLTAHMTPGHSPGCTSWGFTARDGERTYRALVFCSASVAANRLAPDPQYPGIVADYRRTFEKMRDMRVDAWLAPHAEQFNLHEKRARIGANGHPFVDPGEKDRRMAAFERDFEAALEAQTRPD
jgi:metallo-beta-lactamase class B